MTQTRRQLADLVRAVAAIAPPALAEPWDNVGLQVGHPNAPVSRVMTCLELTPETLAEAVERRAEAVVAHHPLIFKPLAALNFAQPVPALVADAIRAGVALVTAHTNLDASHWSTNSVLAESLGWTVEAPMLPRSAEAARPDTPPVGLGVVAALPSPASPRELAAFLKQRLNLPAVRLSGRDDKKIRRVALCTGSGGAFIGRAAVVADAFITGEMNYHHAMEARQRNVPVLEIGHFESEALIAGPLAERLTADPALAGLEIFPATSQQSPFEYL